MPYDAATLEKDLEELLQDIRRKKQADILQGKRRTPSDDTDQALARLQKAYTDVWPLGMSTKQALGLGRSLVKMFGPNGGTRCAFNPQLATTLGMTGRLRPDEIYRWREYDRLPDHIRLS